MPNVNSDFGFGEKLSQKDLHQSQEPLCYTMKKGSRYSENVFEGKPKKKNVSMFWKNVNRKVNNLRINYEDLQNEMNSDNYDENE